MTDRPPLHLRIAAWYERSPHPGLVLAGVVILLYFPSLFSGFMIDDHRCLRVMREYREGLRDRPAAYEFLLGDATNADERRAGNYAWWMADLLKYRHFRPSAEWLLYGEYRIFGEQPIGFHLVSVGMYCASALLIFQLFRVLGNDEILARWAALIFAMTASHAIPIIFMSAQCDLLALLCVAGAMLLLGKFVSRGGPLRLVLATVVFFFGLGAKEAVLPVAAAPLIVLLLWRRQRSARARSILAGVLWLAIGLTWLAWYSRQGYGANASAMLDPARDPMGYLREAPWRALILLCTWIIIVNPFLIEISPNYHGLIVLYAAIGTAALFGVAVFFWRKCRHHPLLLPSVLWGIMFLPVLACTPPDDRVMMLPSIGFALLAALWLRENGNWRIANSESDAPATASTSFAIGPARLRRMPAMLFLVLQPLAVFTITGIFTFMEHEAQGHLRLMASSFQQPMRDDDCLFMINTSRVVETLFTQDRFRRAIGPGHVAVLCDVPYPSVTRKDTHTLRLESYDRPLFSTFLGRMGTVRRQPRRVGDTLHAREFSARITDVQSNQVYAVELTFKDKIDSDRYRFFMNSWNLPPAPFRP